jgi:hypothetical protein
MEMKKTVLALLVVLMLIFTIPAVADQSMNTTPVQSADNIISANVLVYLIGFFNIEYERKIFDALSIRVRASDWALLSLGNSSSGSVGLYGVGADLYIYPAGKACRGFFFGPRIDNYWIAEKSNVTDLTTGNTVTQTGTLSNLRLGVQFGYKWVFDGGFEMAIALGGWSGVSSTWSWSGGGQSTNGTTNPLGGFLPTVDYDIGYAF